MAWKGSTALRAESGFNGSVLAGFTLPSHVPDQTGLHKCASAALPPILQFRLAPRQLMLGLE
jgi:hypothetical protein